MSKIIKSKGLGDTIAKITSFFKLDILAHRIAIFFGYDDCGCDRRRNKLNKLIPYKNAKRRTDTRTKSNKNRK